MKFNTVCIFVFVCLISCSLARDIPWKKCVGIPELGNACVDLIVDDITLNTTVELTVEDRIMFSTPIKGGRECVNQDLILKLAEELPSLKKYKNTIDEILAIEQYIPFEVFNICFEVEKMQAEPLEACFDMSSTVLCWKGNCAWKGKKEMGCLHGDESAMK